MIVTLCLSLLLLLIVMIASRQRILPIGVTVALSLPITVGYAVLDESTGETTWPYYFFGLIALVSGWGIYVAFRRQSLEPRPVGWTARSPVLFPLVVLGLGIYHLAVVGIPILSPKLESVRFDFSGSGLAGIPGRMFLFGIPFVIMYISLSQSGKQKRALLATAWTIFILVEVSSGFKGALLRVLVLLLMYKAIQGTPVRILMPRPTYVLLAVVAIGFAIFLSLRFGTARVENVGESVDYLARRATAGAAEAGHYALTVIREPGEELFVITNVKYFAEKYFSISLGGNAAFPLDQVVSTRLTGVPLSNSAFIVPVTIGAYPEFAVDFGRLWGLVPMFLVGIAYAWTWMRGRVVASAFSGAAFGLSLVTFQAYVVNGGLIYGLINIGAVLVFLFVLERVCMQVAGWLSGRTREAERRYAAETLIRQPQGIGRG